VTSALVDHMRELMEQSLVAWRLTGSVRVSDDGTILLSCDTHEIRIERAAPDLPFRWMVTVGNRRRGAISVVGVLRQVRAALDPGYATMRPLIATFPLVPPP
jgi:hypothetical protein